MEVYHPLRRKSPVREKPHAPGCPWLDLRLAAEYAAGTCALGTQRPFVKISRVFSPCRRAGQQQCGLTQGLAGSKVSRVQSPRGLCCALP